MIPAEQMNQVDPRMLCPCGHQALWDRSYTRIECTHCGNELPNFHMAGTPGLVGVIGLTNEYRPRIARKGGAK